MERFAIVELTNLRRRAECKERDSGDSGEGSSRVTKVLYQSVGFLVELGKGWEAST